MSRSGVIMLIIIVVILFVSLISGLYVYYYCRWKHLWAMDVSIPSYEIKSRVDDTIKVVMIGDSWAGLHHEYGMDAYLYSKLQNLVSCPITIVSKGKGGEKSRGIYQLMFSSGDNGTKSLLVSGPNYCIISAGINDAAANLGTKQFCAHYRLILNFLIGNGIRPVVIEVPDVDIWGLYGGKSKKDLLADYVKSTMTRCEMYNYHEYREELYAMLQKEHLMERVVYIPMLGWNGNGIRQNLDLFMPDRIHLNREGYKRLDACIAEAIARDLQQSQDSTFVNKPVSHDAKQ